MLPSTGIGDTKSAQEQDMFLRMSRERLLLTGPAADEILELHFARLMVFVAGPASDGICCTAACQVGGLDWACRG